MYKITTYQDSAVKDICDSCGSKMAKQSYNYFRRANYRAGQNRSTVWSEVIWSRELPVAFYYAYKCRKHVRLIEIAVKENNQGEGIGKMVLTRLLKRMKLSSIYKLTFRTPIHEPAQKFWLHMGARIIDVKGDDYEMELTIKQN